MRILVLQDRLRSGGTERQSLLLARAFAAAGHDTTLLTFRPGGQLAGDLAGVRHRALQPFDFHLDWFAPGLARAVASLAPEIILCMGRMANSYAGRLQRCFPRAAVVSTLRTGKPLPWLFRRSLATVRHVVANSADARRRALALYPISGDKISVIHNSLVFSPGSDLGSATLRDESLRQRFGATPPTVVLLCVAMFRPEKNQRELIELISQLPAESDWQLWLAGDGPTRTACERAAHASPHADRIYFTGFQTDPSVLYRAADLAVLTSSRESLPNFLIEAHAHGLPSVAYEVGGVAECGGLVVPFGDRAAWLRTTIPLLTDLASRRALGTKAAEFARSHFSPQRQIQAYLDVFARLISSA